MMKHLLLTLATLAILTDGSAQKIELRASANSGLFSFAGNSTHAITTFNYDDQTQSGYTNNPYGTKAGVCYGLSLNLKRVAKSNILFGFDAGYESLRSKVSINKIDGYNGTSTYQYDATGQAYLNSNNLNVSPFIGYRLTVAAVSFDVTCGLDFAYILQSKEKGSASAFNGKTYTSSVDRKNLNVDVSPRIQLSADYKRIGVYTGYSYGLMNYLASYKGDAVFDAYARFVRFGVTYQLK